MAYGVSDNLQPFYGNQNYKALYQIIFLKCLKKFPQTKYSSNIKPGKVML